MSALRHVVEHRRGISYALAPVKLHIALGDHSLPRGNARFLSLHAPYRIADYFSGITVKAACGLSLDNRQRAGVGCVSDEIADCAG
jgi:hypothetical protein